MDNLNDTVAPQGAPPPSTTHAAVEGVGSDADEVDEEDALDEMASQTQSTTRAVTPVPGALGTAQPRQSHARLSPKRRAKDHLKNVRKALNEWRYRTRRVKYKFSSLKAENILPDSNLSAIATHRRGVKTRSDLKRILKPPWPHVDIHGEEVLELVRSLDLEEDSRRLAATLKKCEDRKAATAQRRAEATIRKQHERAMARAEREAGKERNRWAQSLASFSGAMGPSAALNEPVTPTRPATSTQTSAPSRFTSYSPAPYPGYVISGYPYATPYSYAPSSVYSYPASPPPPVATSSASIPSIDTPILQSQPHQTNDGETSTRK